MRIIFTCGGTGGHINPAIAVANAMRERVPDCAILFIGAEGEMEERLVPKAGYDLKCLPASSFARGKSLKSLVKNAKGACLIASALMRVRRIIKEFKPDIVVGTGGYASFPALYMGAKMGIPTCVHESNAVPGLATRMVAGVVDQILVCFEESAKRYKQSEKVKAVGMPVRREFVFADREKARAELGLDERPLIVSAFGSLGARDMNRAMARFMKLECDDGLPYQHIHATGSYGWEWMPEHVKEQGVDLENCPGLDMLEYIYNMPTLMAAADVVISRAGAASCSEIAATGTPCILIPSPNVTDNHQEKNAQVLADRGGCIMVKESECSARRLYDEAAALLADGERRGRMRKALLDWSVPDSTDQICDCIIELSRR